MLSTDELIEQAKPEIKNILFHTKDSISINGVLPRDKKYHYKKTIYATGSSLREALIRFNEKKNSDLSG